MRSSAMVPAEGIGDLKVIRQPSSESLAKLIRLSFNHGLPVKLAHVFCIRRHGCVAQFKERLSSAYISLSAGRVKMLA